MHSAVTATRVLGRAAELVVLTSLFFVLEVIKQLERYPKPPVTGLVLRVHNPIVMSF